MSIIITVRESLWKKPGSRVANYLTHGFALSLWVTFHRNSLSAGLLKKGKLIFVLHWFNGFFEIVEVISTRLCAKNVSRAQCYHFVSPCSNVLRSWSCFFQSLGIQVVLTILLITCTVSFTIRLVDLFKLYNGRDVTKAGDGSTVFLIFASAVSKFKFFLSRWSRNSCNSIMWRSLGPAEGPKSCLRGKDIQ